MFFGAEDLKFLPPFTHIIPLPRILNQKELNNVTCDLHNGAVNLHVYTALMNGYGSMVELY
jgi:hypothetical protein